jgi:hypothetical protein
VLVTSISGEPSIWATLANEAGWAGCIQRTDARGNASLKFLNAGYVDWLCYVESARGSFLIACGENNAFDQAFVALLGIDDPPCGSPPGGRHGTSTQMPQP